MSALKAALLCSVALIVGGCSATRWEQPPPQRGSSEPISKDMSRSKRGNPPFYEVFGVRYQVMDSSAGYKERGIASWYGTKFHGRLTSSGERYDMYRMTAAHKTLPLPVNVRVTNLDNGRSIIVRVNDRGPFVEGRIIDMSYAAAQALDMANAGIAQVEVEVVDTNDVGTVTTAAATRPAAGQEPSREAAEVATAAQAAVAAKMYVQVGAFGDAENARTLATRLTDEGIADISVQEPAAGTPVLYRVRIGPFTDINEYDRIVAEVTALQVASARLVVEESPSTPSTNL